MINLDVYLTLTDGTRLLAGHYACEQWSRPGAPRQGGFIYDPEYLADERAIALDPEGLPLTEQEYAYHNESWMPGCLEDALPDAWGRALLRKAYPEISYRDQPAMLAVCRQGLGALGICSQGEQFTTPSVEPIHELGDLLDAADRVQKGQATDPDIAKLVHAGNSLGGARPKALVHDEHGDWIAKFPATEDIVEEPRVEAACLSLARKAGVETCDFKLVDVAGRPVLLVRRFDISPQGGRYHMISMRTLLGELSESAASYSLYADQVRRWAAQPGENLRRLFRQMVFNICIGNTDDHAKNFSVQYVEEGWRLTPAYDLLPDIRNNREHASVIGNSNYVPGREGVLAVAAEFLVKPSEAAHAIDEVVEAVSDWRDEMQACYVRKRDMDVFARDIDGRLNKLKS